MITVMTLRDWVLVSVIAASFILMGIGVVQYYLKKWFGKK